MDLLREGIEQRAVVKTQLTRKLTLNGSTKAYPVYRVLLDWLFYNDQNDRIATWISQYKSKHEGQIPSISNRNLYNDTIEGFIIESNPDAIRRTQTNIEMVDQREPGVVLSDGRIIDGNRRFTCLRRLARTNSHFSYFETVILDGSIETNAKTIKMLELSIQHGEESKVDYNPVDRLVGVYNDIVDTHLLSIEEYARSTNESETDVRRRIETAKLMVEFLDFINAPKQFYIARDMQVTFPLEELLKLMKKCQSNDVSEKLKIAVFTNLMLQTSTDMTRFVRNFKSIIGSDYQEVFFEEQKVLSDRLLQLLPPADEMSMDAIHKVIQSRTDLANALSHSVENAILRAKRVETRNRPIQLIEKATGLVESIDVNILRKMNGSEFQSFVRQLSRLEDAIVLIKTDCERR